MIRSRGRSVVATTPAPGRDERGREGLAEQERVVALRAWACGDVLDAFLDAAAVEQHAIAVDAREGDLLEIEHGVLEQMPIVVDHDQPVVGFAHRERDLTRSQLVRRAFRDIIANKDNGKR